MTGDIHSLIEWGIKDGALRVDDHPREKCKYTSIQVNGMECWFANYNGKWEALDRDGRLWRRL